MFSWRSPKLLPLIVAHRGSSAIAPENTLAAFHHAMTDGADAIELDVHLSKDHEVVVIHDDRLERTTNGSGKVRDRTLEDLKKLSAGLWFHKRFSSEKIPTLGEVLDLVEGKLGINIEVKVERSPDRRLDIVKRCLDVIHEYRASRFVMISSFHHPAVRQVNLHDPNIATGVLYHPLRNFRRSARALVAASHADFFIANKSAIRKRMVEEVHKSGFRAGAYSINTRKSLERMQNMNVDCIFSDNPAVVLALLHRERGG